MAYKLAQTPNPPVEIRLFISQEHLDIWVSQQRNRLKVTQPAGWREGSPTFEELDCSTIPGIKVYKLSSGRGSVHILPIIAAPPQINKGVKKK